MTHYALPTIEQSMDVDQKELVVIQATAQIVCCVLQTEAQAGQPSGDIDHPSDEAPYLNLRWLIGAVKESLDRTG